MILIKHCWCCWEPMHLLGGEDYVMICQSCCVINVVRWDQASRPLHHTDIMLMHLKTRLVLAAVALDAQLRQIAELEAIA